MNNGLSNASEVAETPVSFTKKPSRSPESELIEFPSGGASAGAGVQPGRARYRLVQRSLSELRVYPILVEHHLGLSVARLASTKLGPRLMIPTSELDRIIVENLRTALEDPQSAPALLEERLADA